MIIVDVETTGLDPIKNSIVSIGAIAFSKPENQFYQECRIFEGAEISVVALKINGFSLEQIKDINKKQLKDTIKEFIDWLNKSNDKTIAGHNPFFDRDFLTFSALRFDIKLSLPRRLIDLHSLCYSHYLKRGLIPPLKDKFTDLNLDKVLNYVGLQNEPKPHNALTGAKMEAEAFSRLIHGKILSKEFIFNTTVNRNI